MKKHLSAIFGILVIGMSQIVCGASIYMPSSKVIAVISDLKMQVSPKVKKVDAAVYTDEKKIVIEDPIVTDGNNIYLPMRALGETVGKTVKWSQSYRVAAYINDNMVLEVPLNRAQAVVNGEKAIQIDSESDRTVGFAKEGRTYLPQKFIAEQLGYSVTYFANNDSPEIHLTSPGRTAPKKPVNPCPAKPTPITKPNGESNPAK